MKLSLSSIVSLSRTQPAYRNVTKHFFNSSPLLISRSDAYPLYKRITPLGDPNISIVPVLDQWIQEGRKVEKEDLNLIIKELKLYKRFKHALEISQWMTDRRYIPMTGFDSATRLNLIYRVHGLEQVEEYFNKIPRAVKSFEVCLALLNCYVLDKRVEKAEGAMQKLRDMGYNGTFAYNILMKLYSHVGNFEKIDILVHEMGEKGIFGDNYTFTIRLQAYAASSDCDKIDMIMTRIESDPMIVMDCHTLAAAATALLKVGSVDRSLKMLHKLERLLKTYNRRSFWFNVLLILYGQIGKKDELYRVWDLYKKEKIINKGYMNMINSLLMCDDIEGAEKIFEEWESRGLSYDFRVPNYLIDAYIKNGDLVKAESLLNQGLAKGGKPSFYTWYLMASGYIEHNEVVQAVEALKKAILVFPPTWKYSKDNMVICLGFLDGRGDVEKAEEIVRLAEMVPILSATEKRFHRFIKDQISKLKECNRKEHSG